MFECFFRWLVNIDLLTHVYKHFLHLKGLEPSWTLSQWWFMWCLYLVTKEHSEHVKPLMWQRMCSQYSIFVLAMKLHCLQFLASRKLLSRLFMLLRFTREIQREDSSIFSVSCSIYSVSVEEEQLSPSWLKQGLSSGKCVRTALRLELLCFGVQWLIRCSVNSDLKLTNLTNICLRILLI